MSNWIRMTIFFISLSSELYAGFFPFGPESGGENGRWIVGGGLVMDVSNSAREETVAIQTSGGPIFSAEYSNVRSVFGSFTIVDARIFAALLTGARIEGLERDATVYFSLRLIGSFTAGFQLFQVVPITISAEDVHVDLGTSGIRGQSLLGTTVMIPINVIERMGPNTALYFGVTFGSRQNSQASQSVFAFQPKLRLLSQNYSVELRSVIGVSDQVNEQTGVVQFSRTSIFSNSDQLGIYLRIGHLDDRANPEQPTIQGEGFVFYGRDF